MGLFWAKGFEGAHLNELVEVTGLNRFSLYKEFGGKDGLFRHALNRYIVDAERTYDDVLGAKPLGLENIIHYFDQIRFPEDYHGCFMINTLTEKHIVSAEAFEMARRTVLKAERLFKRNLKAAQQSGELSADKSPHSLARLLSVIDQGMAIYGITTPSSRSRTQIIKQVRALLG